jgi:acetoin:2,6-dichlorophenolindophenol oxidoreductase subunit alpha
MDQEVKLGLFRALLLARAFEEKKLELAQEIGKADIGPTSCYGQEAIPVGFCFGLKRDDFVAVSIRSAWPAYLTKGMPVGPIAMEMYGKAGGYSKCREISSHITDLSYGMIGGTGILANWMTVASGVGLAAKVRGTDQVSVCFLGDGTSNREEFFTSINFAALKKLPTVFVVENNQIAEHTYYQDFMPIENIADRAIGFGIPGIIVDGNDVLAVYEVAQEAYKRARRGEGPTLVEAKTFRVRPMSEMEPEAKGLPKEKIEEWKKKDPVKRIKEYILKEKLLPEKEIQGIEEGYRREVGAAFEAARKAGHNKMEEVFQDVYTEGMVAE